MLEVTVCDHKGGRGREVVVGSATLPLTPLIQDGGRVVAWLPLTRPSPGGAGRGASGGGGSGSGRAGEVLVEVTYKVSLYGEGWG